MFKTIEFIKQVPITANHDTTKTSDTMNYLYRQNKFSFHSLFK